MATDGNITPVDRYSTVHTMNHCGITATHTFFGYDSCHKLFPL